MAAIQVAKLREVFRNTQFSDLHGEILYYNANHDIIGCMFFHLNVKTNTPTARLVFGGNEENDVWRPYNTHQMTPTLMKALIEADIVDLYYLYVFNIDQEIKDRTLKATCFDHPRHNGASIIVRRFGMLKTIICMSKLSHWLGESTSFTHHGQYVFTNFPVK